MVSHRHIHVNGGSRTSQEHHYQPEATKQYSEHLETRSYQERLDSRFFGYGPEFRREGGDYLTLKNALHQILPQAAYRTWETSISRQQDEQLPYMGTARLAKMIGVSMRKIQLDFQYMEQRHLLRRIPAMHSDGYPVHLLDYSGLYQLAHEYLVFKASPFGTIPPDPEFIRLAPPEVQAQLMHYHSYAAAMTHHKRGRKPRSTWTPLHAIHKIPLESTTHDREEAPPIDIHQSRSFYTAKKNLQKNLHGNLQENLYEKSSSLHHRFEQDSSMSDGTTTPARSSHDDVDQYRSFYTAKKNLQDNLQTNLKDNLKRISPYESESYDSNIDSSERDSNPSSLHNFFEADSAPTQEQRLHQLDTTQERPRKIAPPNQTSRQDSITQEKAVIKGGAREAAQRWPKLHHSIERFITDISREFHDTASLSSMSQARRIYFEQLHPLGLRMDHFYDLLVFFKAEAQYAVIAKRNTDGQPNRMAWFFAAIRNHVHRVLTWALQSGAPRTAIVDEMLHLVGAKERKAATQTEQPQHHRAAPLHHAPTEQSAFPQSPHDDALDHQESVGENDMPLLESVPGVQATDPRRLRVQQALTHIRSLVNTSFFVRYDDPCRHCLCIGARRATLCTLPTSQRVAVLST